MTAPTVAVTAKLSSFGGPALAGIVITVTADRDDNYDGLILRKTVTATTDENGEAVFDLFPNALNTATLPGLGTTGSTYRFTASVPNGWRMDVRAQVPDQACDLHAIAMSDEADLPTPGEVAGAVRYNVAQTLSAPQQAQARANIGFDAAVRATTLTGIDTGTNGTVTSADSVLTALGKTYAKIVAYIAAVAASSGSALVGWIQAGTGAVARTLQAKARERVSLEDFGAVGNGIADDSAAFIAALVTGKLVTGSKGSTYVLKDIEISGGHFDGGGCVLQPASGAQYLLKLTGYASEARNFFIQDNGNAIAQITLSAGASTSATSLSVSSASRLAVDMPCWVRLDTGKHHRSRITGIVGTTVTVADALPSAAASGNSFEAGWGLIRVSGATYFNVKDVLIINGWVGVTLQNSSRGSLSFNMDGARIAALVAGADVHDVEYEQSKINGGVTKTVSFTGDASTATFSWADPVFLTQDISVTVNGVAKVLTTDWTFASSTSLTFNSPPANGAAILINHFVDGYSGIVVDSRATTAASGANYFNNVVALDFEVGWEFDGATLDSTEQCISDTCQKALSVKSGSDKLFFNGFFAGFSFDCIDVSGSSTNVYFDSLYSKRVPTSYTYTGTTGTNVTVGAASVVNIDEDTWAGGETTSVSVAGTLNRRSSTASIPVAGLTFAGSGGSIEINATATQISFSKDDFNYVSAVGGASAKLQIQATQKVILAVNGAIQAELTAGATAFSGTVSATGFTGPLTGNVTGNVSGTAGSVAASAITGTTLAANVVTSNLTAVGTIATGVWQGTAITDTYLATISTAGKVANSATTATSANTASAIVARDASGNFTAGTITAALTGNASTATTLATARNINGVSFNGSADITVAAAAGTLTGNTLAAGVTASSLTSVGTLTALTVSGQASFAAGSAAAPGVKVGAEQNGLYSSAANTLDVTLNGVRQFQFGYTAAAVNYLRVFGSATGGSLGFFAEGADTNIGVNHATKGTGVHSFLTNGSVEQFRVAHVANAVNRITVYGNATGSAPAIFAEGSDTNISFGLYSKGSGGVFAAVRGAVAGWFDNPVSAVNYAQITGAATGNAVRYGVQGTDANITWAASSKGTFGLGFYTNSFAQLQFAVGHIASAVNYLLVQGSGTGLNPVLIAQGSDANIGVTIASKGSGNVGIYTGAGAVGSFFVTHTASGVNWVQTTGSTTGNAVSMTAGGSDANIDFLLGGKGTGVLRFGAHSALAAETVTGYITVKDSAGNTRKLAVVS